MHTLNIAIAYAKYNHQWIHQLVIFYCMNKQN